MVMLCGFSNSRHKVECYEPRKEEYHTADAKLLHRLAGQAGGVYAVAFSPDDRTIASAGLDGLVRFNRVETGELISEFVPVPVESQAINN